MQHAICHMNAINTFTPYYTRDRKRGGAVRENEAMSVSVNFLLLDD